MRSVSETVYTDSLTLSDFHLIRQLYVVDFAPVLHSGELNQTL